MHRFALGVVAGALLLGCGSDDSDSNQGTGGQGGAGGGSCAALSTPYPAEPYGKAVGSVFPPLLWSGHVNETAEGVATTKNIADYSSDDIRKTCKPFALVHISEFV